MTRSLVPGALQAQSERASGLNNSWLQGEFLINIQGPSLTQYMLKSVLELQAD